MITRASTAFGSKWSIRGAVLKAVGYDTADDRLQADHWWDTGAETWYLPHPVADKDRPTVVDLARTVTHGLGFVPIAWTKNLPGGDGTTAGARSVRPSRR